MDSYKEFMDCINRNNIANETNLMLAVNAVHRRSHTNIGPIYHYDPIKCVFEGKYHSLSNEFKKNETPPSLEKLCGKKGGVYLIFEDGETLDGFSRITRVGRSLDNLVGRLKEHFCPITNRKTLPKDNSVFRKHIGKALLSQNSNSDEDKANWNKKGETVDGLEDKISDLLAKKFSFCVIPLDDKDEIKILEKTLIRLLSTYNVRANAIPSPTWLGNAHPTEEIQKSGLWNVKHVII